MQRLTFVRYTVKPDQIAANEALSRAVFREMRGTAPKDVTYALFKKDADFVHLFVNFRADDSEAVTGLPSFKVYSKDVASRCAGTDRADPAGPGISSIPTACTPWRPRSEDLPLDRVASVSACRTISSRRYGSSLVAA